MSFNHSESFELSNKSDEDNAVVHHWIKGVGNRCATTFEDAQEDGSLTRRTNKRRTVSKVAWIAGKKTKSTENK